MKSNAVSVLVPMKGHSERVPSKNTRILGNVPLFYHILRSLESAQSVYEILVNTDSEKIKDLLHKDFPKIVIIDRPPQLLGDKVPMTPIIEYDLKFIKTGHFMQTHVTSPFIKPATIDSAIETYFEGLSEGFDSVMGVNRFQTRFYDQNKKPVNHNPNIMVPSQDMPPLYEDNSSFYINSIENFMKYKNRVGRNPIFIEIPKLESLDIDEENDFILCQALYNYLNSKNK
ncbi:MAG: acylneuraminate cytidylyltransferase family protein [Elusimicrobia bacterium]|nr:acylneuraminate cytidylyltransferase family protein [Elusimicrobiota bacterium]